MKYFTKKQVGMIVTTVLVTSSIVYGSTNPGGTLGGLFKYISSGTENNIPIMDEYRLDGRNIEDGTVTSYELADYSVNGDKIEDNSITSNDIALGAITSSGILNGTILQEDLDPSIYLGDGKWQENGDKIFYNSGSVGIGVEDPTSKLEVNGNIQASGSIDGNRFYVQSGATMPNENKELASKEYVDSLLAGGVGTDVTITAPLQDGNYYFGANINETGTWNCSKVNIAAYTSTDNKEGMVTKTDINNYRKCDNGKICDSGECVLGSYFKGNVSQARRYKDGVYTSNYFNSIPGYFISIDTTSRNEMCKIMGFDLAGTYITYNTSVGTVGGKQNVYTYQSWIPGWDFTRRYPYSTVIEFDCYSLGG